MAAPVMVRSGAPAAVVARAELRAALAPLSAVSLEELEEAAALQVRNDRKYLLPPERIATLLEVARQVEEPRVLEIDGERLFRYESLYFDSPQLTNYFDAAHGRPRRRKVRTRTYVDSGLCVLEVKERDNHGHTVKHRLPYESCDRGRLTQAGREFVATTGIDAVERLAPVLASSYRRATLLFERSGVRATIDVDLAWSNRRGERLHTRGFALVETKSLARAPFLDRMLWRSGHRPVAISKYCTGLAALSPQLPANRWHRTLQWVRALNGGEPPLSVLGRRRYAVTIPQGG